jgi:glycosyltransferase involved in cell wall biosynthesis
MVDDYLSESLSPSLIDRIFPFPWTGILIFPRALLAARAADAAASPPPMLRASRCLGLQVLDEGLIPFAEATYRIPFQHFPDVTNVTLAGDTQSPEGAEIVRRARSRLVTGLFGTLDRRKGILFLLEIIRKADPTKYFFAICGDAVGSPTPEFLAFLATLAREQHENVIFRRGRIPDGPPFNSLLVSSDVVFACYEDFPYSSNILTKAAAFRRPVLVSTKGLLAERVNRFHLGLAVTFGDADAAVSALAELDRRRHLPTDAQFEAYSVLHSRTSLLAAAPELPLPRTRPEEQTVYLQKLPSTLIDEPFLQSD